MKRLGIFLIVVGLALIIFLTYSFFAEKNRLKSPLPEEEGVKVIIVTPSK